ncbi:MAG: bifunctional diaminohydroxyphosphoribosylaminopyrimidine deaminase/5-amino-6-(5-phosphoribosylamino)uracil reductase RibD [Mariprofundaceae bacterium]|nr:bifunctional diaminohydroxyphosphoribosylaminopyrimidine deaminase/5-amino-6-(5-phosphoribosylamino)uracil reductase RibD [Mariprofundaceae bacterium]
MLSDEYWMTQAIVLAKRGIARTHPNPRVGALLVQQGQIVGKGWHQRAGEAHAEVHAIDDAHEQAQGATLYVTLEPCAGHGRTPPCTGCIIRAGIMRVVYASNDPNPAMQGGGAYLAQQGIAVTAAVCKDQADAINRPFFYYIHHKMPYVIGKAAISLDGKLATRQGHSQWISGGVSRQHAHALRAASDAIIVGAGTLRADNPSLTIRDAALLGQPPLRVVMARQVPVFFAACKLLQTNEYAAGSVRFYVQESAPLAAAPWIKQGVEIVRVETLKAALQHLANEGRLQILLEGGGILHAAFFEHGFTQELVLYQAPCLIGGTTSINLWHGLGIASMAEAPRLEQITTQMLGEDRLIRGILCYAKSSLSASIKEG